MPEPPEAPPGDDPRRDEARRSRAIALTAVPMLALVVGAAAALAAIGASVSDVGGCASSAYTRAVAREVLAPRPGETLLAERDECVAPAPGRRARPAVRNLILSPEGPASAAARGAPSAGGDAGPLRVTVRVARSYPPGWPPPALTDLRAVLDARSFVEVAVRRVSR